MTLRCKITKIKQGKPPKHTEGWYEYKVTLECDMAGENEEDIKECLRTTIIQVEK